MKVTAADLGLNLTQDEVDILINSMALSLYDFSRIACLDGRAYGVRTLCDTCDYDLNACARKQIIRLLLSVQSKTEGIIGYPLSERYIRETVDWNGSLLMMTETTGLESIGYSQLFSEIEDFGPFEISPYIQEDIVIQNSGDGFCIALVDASLVKNPNKVVIRDENGRIYSTYKVQGYPRRVAGEWQIPLEKQMPPPCDLDDHTFNVQHCEYMILEVDVPECEGDLEPVYPGTNQIIPYVEVEEVDADTVRYWFNPWVLVDRDFSDDIIDLAVGEFYKLIPEIEFRCVTEVACAPIVTYLDRSGCYLLTFTPEEGAVQMDIRGSNPGLLMLQQTADFRCQGVPVQIEFCYKANPNLIYVNAYESSTVKEAMAYLVAADLPMESCGCELKTGFIKDAQRSYSAAKINPMSGEVIINVNYDDLHGRIVYQKKISEVTKYQRLLVLDI